MTQHHLDNIVDFYSENIRGKYNSKKSTRILLTAHLASPPRGDEGPTGLRPAPEVNFVDLWGYKENFLFFGLAAPGRGS